MSARLLCSCDKKTGGSIIQTEVTETINAPPDKVFNCIANVSDKMKWSKNVENVTIVLQSPNFTGSIYKVTSSPFGKHSEEVYEVVQYDKDNEVVFAVTSKQSRKDHYYVSNNGQTTTIKLVVSTESSGLMRKMLLTAGLKTGNKLLLKELKTYLESTT